MNQPCPSTGNLAGMAIEGTTDALAKVVSNETFEGSTAAATQGWSFASGTASTAAGGTPAAPGPGNNYAYFSQFLGTFANGAKVNGQDAWKTFSLDGTGGTISFDLYRIDSWDGEKFRVYANDQIALEASLGSADITTAISGVSNSYSWTITPKRDYGAHFGVAGWNDQTFRVTVTVPTGVKALKLGFGSTLDQPSSDEAYGIDALSVVNAPTLYSTTSAPPTASKALWLDGVDDYTDIPDISLGGDVTVEAWVYVNKAQTWSRIVDIGNGPANNNILLATFGDTGRLAFETYGNGVSNGKVVTDEALPTSRWVHVAAVLNTDKSVQIYWDGVLQKSGSQSALPVEMVRTNSWVGRSNWSADSYFNGSIRDLKIWSDARTPTEVRSDMSLSPSGSDNALAAWYPFSDNLPISFQGTPNSSDKKIYLSVNEKGINKPIMANGSQIFVGIYAADGWQTLGAARVDGVNRLLWYHQPSNQSHYWNLDANWNYLNSSGMYAMNSQENYNLESQFGIDISRDGLIGSPSANTLNIAPSRIGGSAGAMLIAGASISSVGGTGATAVDGSSREWVGTAVDTAKVLYSQNRSALTAATLTETIINPYDSAAGSSRITGQVTDNEPLAGSNTGASEWRVSYDSNGKRVYQINGLKTSFAGAPQATTASLVRIPDWVDNSTFSSSAYPATGSSIAFGTHKGNAPFILGYTPRTNLETFENASGWSVASGTVPIARNNSYYGPFLGVFANGAKSGGQDVWKTYVLDGNGGQITLTMHRMDTWDGEPFRVYANDQIVFQQNLVWNNNYFNAPFTDVTRVPGFTGTSVARNDFYQHYGANTYSDQSFDISITIPAGVTSLKLGFGSGLDEPISNESYGIDNVSVTNASQNPSIYAPSSSSPNLDYVKSTAALSNRSIVNAAGTLRTVGMIPAVTSAFLASSGSKSSLKNPAIPARMGQLPT